METPRGNGALGKLAPREDERTLLLASYVTPQVEPPPPVVRWQDAVASGGWGMMGNDHYGNCVIVTAAHMLLAWQANARALTTRLSDEAVVTLSKRMKALSGYVVLDRLKWWRKRGMWGNVLGAFASISPDDPLDMRVAISEFGAADLGLSMPAAWQREPVWDTGRGSRYVRGSWGGHSVPAVGYDADGVDVVTWGRVQRITWRAIRTYCDEGWAAINSAWLTAAAVTPHGFDMERLAADLAEVTR